jgi:uncharacterized protein YlxW (UPF0749 family)
MESYAGKCAQCTLIHDNGFLSAITFRSCSAEHHTVMDLARLRKDLEALRSKSDTLAAETRRLTKESTELRDAIARQEAVERHLSGHPVTKTNMTK